MKVKDFLEMYKRQPGVVGAVGVLSLEKRLQLRGLMGGSDVVVAAAIAAQLSQNCVFVLADAEQATHFAQDLQGLLENREVMFLPSSYKKPYLIDEVINANLLERTQTLSLLNGKTSGALVVAYPESLNEKVVSRPSLSAHTYVAHVGEQIEISFLSELLNDYHFERTDFVYEAGQYALRGGIVDVYSFASDLPFRIEFLGDQIESIRVFNPETQLSAGLRDSISIIPDLQTKLEAQTRESLIDFLAPDTIFWFKDLQQVFVCLDNYFDKASQAYDQIQEIHNGKAIVSPPDSLFESSKSLKENLKNSYLIEFGHRYAYKSITKIEFETRPQPAYNKDFKLLTKELAALQASGFINLICAEQPKQLERLGTIFEEIDPFLKFQGLYLSLREGFVDKQGQIVCYTDHQILERFKKTKAKEKFSKSKALTLRELKTLQPGDYVTHIDYGIGRFAGLEKVSVNGHAQEAVRLVYRDDDFLFVSIHALHKISKYSGKEGGPPSISKLGTSEWEAKKAKVKGKVKDIAKELIQLYAKRKATGGFAFSKENFLQAELESSFIYEDTPDQAKAATDTKNDMERPYPMDRLVCGDVGFGKTEIAIRAAFKAVIDKKQVAVLVPTTILAMQHYKTFKERLAKFGVAIDYVNRFKSAKDITQTLARLSEGKLDILIGTHRIASADIKFKDLGLMIIDEEQKFGVKVKERLKEFKVNVDCLTLTATPIPRTLQFSLLGARDLSIIATAPPNRQPVSTQVAPFSNELIRDAVAAEIRRGGQVFFVHNRISDIMEMANIVLMLVPDARVAVAHGQMDGTKLENVMLKFIEGEYDVLVSTNIIESGLDISNANTIIINRAHTYGMSDLHQMRGRVGRSNRKAYCYLLTPPAGLLSTDARKRLQTLEEFSELGEGFKIAMRDLDIRGAGNILGSEQSGFISDLGFEAYHKILDEALEELKESEFAALFQEQIANRPLVNECIVETDLEMLIPETYIQNISERLNLYGRLETLKTEEDIIKLTAQTTDRFGLPPRQFADLLQTVRLRWLAQASGFDKMTIKDKTMKGYFLESRRQKEFFDSDIFGRLLDYARQNPKTTRLKEHGKRMIMYFYEIKNIADACDRIEKANKIKGDN